MADQLHQQDQGVLEEQEDRQQDNDQVTGSQDQGQPKSKSVIARAASSFGDLSYSVDVNPIVMSRAPDPLEQFSGNQLKAQDAYFEEQEKKHRQNLHVLAMHENIDASRQQKQRVQRHSPKAKAKNGALIEAILSGKDANQFVKDVNFASDKKREQEHQRIKQQVRTDIEQQVTGADINPRQQALDDQADSALDQVLDSGTLSGRSIASASDGPFSTTTSEKTTETDKSENTGQTEKTILGQDDNSLGLTDAKSGLDNMDDPADLLNMIQADFEVIGAEQTVSANSLPMINLNIRLGEIPSTIRDKNGFVVDLSKKDLAKLKNQLKKRLGKEMKMPVPIKTFNHLIAGNHQPSYNETELSNTILKGNHIDFSKSISENSPLKFRTSYIEKDNKPAEPDLSSFKTPVDLQLESNRRNRVERLNQADLKAFTDDLKLKREDHSKQDTKLKQPSKTKSGPELDM